MTGTALVAARPAILLVDDDPFMLDLQSGMLRGLGYADVHASGDARAALATLLSGESRPDVIVCDLNMPGMDGVQFLQALNASPFSGSIILLSGEGARILHTVQKLLRGGRLTVLGALEKPGRPQAIRALIDCWVPPGVVQAPARAAPSITEAAVLEAARTPQWLLHFQPKVELVTGAVAGVEALVRWNHPQHGLLYPDAFIGIAEECGAIDSLTEWVLVHSVAQFARWSAAGLHLPVAINVSMDNLGTPDFASRVAAIAHAAGVAPQDITLEITESRAMSPLPAPLECLVRLRLLRFNLAIDDFGTGHSSLAQLRDVPFSELKIDRGFVHGARRNQIIRPMLEGSIGLASRLGMVSVAEGVETLEDFELLREIECDLAQGYFIGRPMEVEKLPAWVSEWQRRRAELFGP
ncbi:MAG: EAL domain-containing response regulator [Burkholderiales bacterium]|nr:EAL domain-containing response regulator [Burkholderiales bacterium]